MNTLANQSSAPSMVVIGYTNLDINRYWDDTEVSGLGGGGYFAAVAASRLLKDVGFVSRVGGDFDIEQITRYVRADAVLQVSSEHTATSIQTYNDQHNLSDRSIELIPGVNPGLSADDIPRMWLTSASVILLSTMVPAQHLGIAQALQAVRGSRKVSFAGYNLLAPVICVDSDLCWLQRVQDREQVAATMRCADVVFMNQAEQELLRELIPEIPIAVLKRDAHGAAVFHYGEQLCSLPAPEVEVVDATGAGDVFAGTLLAALVRGEELQSALAMAITTASRAITKNGVEHLFE